MNAPHSRKFISTKEASELSDYNPDHLSRLARAGEIEAVRVGRTWHVEHGSLVTFLKKQGRQANEFVGLISTKEASKKYGYSADYLARLARSGEIKGSQVGHTWLVDRESLQSFLKAQEERKEARANALARARETEYRARQAILKPVAKDLASPLQTSRSGAGPIRHQVSDRSHMSDRNLANTTLRSHALAFSTAFLVVASGAFVAQAAFIPQLAERATALAREAASGFEIAFAGVPERVAEKFSAPRDVVRTSSVRVAAMHADTTTRLSQGISNFQLSISKQLAISNFQTPERQRGGKASKLAVVSADEQVLMVEDFHAFVRAVYAVLASPADTHRAIGVAGYRAIENSFAAYRALIEDTGSRALSLAATTRDTLSSAPRLVHQMNLALGEAVITTTHAVIHADISLAYSLATTAPASARATVAFIGATGDALATATSRIPALATTAYLRATALPAELAPAIASAVFDAEYALATHFVPAALTLSERYLALLQDAGAVTHAGTTAALALADGLSGNVRPAQALANARLAITNAYLGTLGHLAAAFDTVNVRLTQNAPMAAVLAVLSPAEQLALATYDTLHGWFSGTTSALATLFGSTSLTTGAPTSPAPTIVMPELPTKTPVIAVAPTSLKTYPLPLTPSTSNFYTTLVQGVSQNYVDQSLVSLKNNLLGTMAGMIQPVATQGITNMTTIQQVNMIEKLDGLIVTNGDFQGGTLIGATNVTGTNATFTNLTTSNLTAGATTITGDLSVSGTITPGTIAAGTSISAPYFTATSTTATSTFAGGFTVGTDKLVVDSTTGYIGIGTTSPYAMLSVAGHVVGSYFTATSPTSASTFPYASTTAFTASGTGYLGLGQFTNTTGTTTIAAGQGFTIGDSQFVLQQGSGNVGVGTTIPASALHVVGSTALNWIGGGVTNGLVTIGSQGTSGSSLFVNTPSLNGNYASGFAVDGSYTNPGGIGTSVVNLKALGVSSGGGYDSSMAFYTTLDGTATEKMRINSSGNVGIGTTSPRAKMEIMADQNTFATAFTSPHLKLGLGTGTNNTGYTGIAYAVSGNDNYGWTTGALREVDGETSSFVFKRHNNSAEGVEFMRINNSGNVGIGTTSPGARLQVDGVANTYAAIFQSSLTTGQAYGPIIRAGTNSSDQAFTVNDSTNVIPYFRVRGDGNVGIGTTGPVNALHVVKDDATTNGVTNVLRLDHTTTGTPAAGMGTGISFVTDSAGGNVALASINAIATDVGDGTHKGALTFRTVDWADDGDVERVRIDRDGNVGIGTTSPFTTLTLPGANYIGWDSYAGQSASRRWGIRNDHTVFGDFAIIQSSTQSGTLDTPRLTINPSGNVGIGTTDPGAYKLNVNGDFNATNVYANGVLLSPTSGSNWSLSGVNDIYRSVGNVGIGVAPTAGKLQVAGSISATGAQVADIANMITMDYVSTSYGRFVVNGPDATTRGSLRFTVTESDGGNTLTPLTLNNAGLVGIGTTTPQQKLSIGGIGELLGIGGPGEGTGVTYGRVQNNGGDLLWGVERSIGGAFGTGALAYAGVIDTNNPTALQFGTNNVMRMTIDTSGNVGIGTTSPSQLLTVYKDSNTAGPQFMISNPDQTASDKDLTITAYGDGQNGGEFGLNTAGSIVLKSHTGGSSPLIIGNISNEAMMFGTNNLERMRITAAGNVGIGTTSPRSALHVENGTNAMITSVDSGAAMSASRPAWRFGANAANFNIQSTGDYSTYLQRLTIDTSGNVGIGTTTPAAVLNIGGTAGTLLQVGTLDNTWGGNIVFGVEASDGILISKINTPNSANRVFTLTRDDSVGATLVGYQPDGTTAGYVFRANSTSYINGGNVGIGTTTPATRLSVVDTTQTDGPIDILTLSAGKTAVNGSGPRIAFINYYGSDTLSWRTGDIGSTYEGGQYGGNLIFRTNSGTSATDLSTKMTIMRNGNVGIGTTTPGALLQVHSSQAIRLSNSTTATDGFLGGVDFNNTNAEGAATNARVHGLRGNAALEGRITFETRDGVTLLERMRIDENGNVGIGTTSPSGTGTSLEVSGATSDATVKISGKSGADGNTYLQLHPTGTGNAYVNALSGYLALGANGEASNAVTILSSGNVGIGTTNPVASLEVAGTGIRLGGVTRTTWPTGSGTGAFTDTGSLAYYNGGNVGIGTTTPDEKLVIGALNDVWTNRNALKFSLGGWENPTAPGVGSQGDKIIFYNSGSSQGKVAQGMDGAGRMWFQAYDSSAGGFSWWSGSTPTQLMVLQGNGNIGIGTTVPDAKLVVSDGTADANTNANAMLKLVHASGPQLLLIDAANSLSGIQTKTNDMLFVNNTSSGAFRFRSGITIAGAWESTGSELFTIKYDGNVGIGTTTPNEKLNVVGSIRMDNPGSINQGGALRAYDGVGTAVGYLAFGLSNDQAGVGDAIWHHSIAGKTMYVQNVSSGVTLAQAGTTWGQVSDERLKQNITPLTNASGLAALNELTPMTYNWKDTNTTSQVQYGFTAQNMQEVFPTFVYTTGNTTIALADGTTEVIPNTLNMTMTNLIPPMVKAIQELDSRTRFIQNAATSTVLTVDVAGNVGIGTSTPNHTLSVAGDIGAIAFVNTSTKSLKKDINYTTTSSSDDRLDQLVNLKVATYRYTIEDQADPLRIGLISEDTETIAPEILSADGKGVDLYQLATFTLSGVQALAAKFDALGTRVTSLEDRLTALESGAVSSASGSPLSLGSSTLASALEGFGVLIRQGIAQFNTLVFRQLVASSDADGTSSAGSVALLAGNTVAQVSNSLVLPSTKVFVTFNSQITGSWWVSDKLTGSFRVVLSEAQAGDVSFDYFLVQTEGQIATSTPLDSSASNGASSPASTGSGTTAPVITLIGDNPLLLSVGSVFTDPGISVSNDLPYITFVNGLEQEVNASTIDTSSPTTYIVTYKATDAAGNTVTAIRSVIVGNPDGTISSPGIQDPTLNTDTAAPTVTLTGAAALELAVGDTFTDPGATATDDVDGDLTASIVVTITDGSGVKHSVFDTTAEGSYTLTYTATDVAGNAGSVSRLVTILAPATP